MNKEINATVNSIFYSLDHMGGNYKAWKDNTLVLKENYAGNMYIEKMAESEADFLASVKISIENLKGLLNKLDGQFETESAFVPTNITEIKATAQLLEVSGVKPEVIERIIEQYKFNDTAMNLIMNNCNECYKPYFEKYQKGAKGLVSELKGILENIQYHFTSEYGVMNTLHTLQETLEKKLCYLYGIEVDVTKYPNIMDVNTEWIAHKVLGK